MSRRKRLALVLLVLAAFASLGGRFGRTTSSMAAATGNYVVNGGGSVWQRGTTLTATNAANDNGNYTADQWVVLSGSTAGKQDDIVDLSYDVAEIPVGVAPQSILLTATTPGTPAEKFGLYQLMEADRVRGLQGDTVSLSMWAMSADIATLRVAIVEWQGTADTPTSMDPISAWGAISVEPTPVTDFVFASTGVCTMSAAWAECTLEGVSISTDMENLGVMVWVDEVWTAAETLNLTGFRLVRGDAAVRYVARPYDAELLEAERFLASTFLRGDTPQDNIGNYDGAVHALGSTECQITWRFRTQMHATPTVTWYNPFATGAGSVYNVGTGGDATPTGPWGSAQEVGFTTATAAANSGELMVIHGFATAEF